MRRYLLDTGIAGDYINDRNDVVEKANQRTIRGDQVGICVPVLGELYYGAEFSNSRPENLKRLRYAVSTLRIWPYTEEAAAEFGRLRAELRRMGRPMQPIDIQIAAIALTLGRCTIVTTDSDLNAIPGLKVENWAS